jgi:endothelin-converting enzyme/putative endopeptidase
MRLARLAALGLAQTALVCAAVASCRPAQVPREENALVGVDEAALDKSVDPCTDFYEYACGGWIKATPIPEDRPAWSRGFSVLDDENEKKLRAILDGYAAGKNSTDAYAAKVAAFWTSCMDEPGIERAGIEPLKPAFAVIDSLEGGKDLARVAKELWAMGLHPLFGFSSGQDFKDATQVIGQLEQGGIGLPDRDYYFDTGKKAEEIRAAYVEHVGKLLALAALDAGGARAVMTIETELAKASMTRVERRDPKKVYHRMALDGLVSQSPSFGWESFIVGLGVGKNAPINVAQPEFVKHLSELTTQVSTDDWKAYLKWSVIDERVGSLPKAFVDQDFAFTSKWLSGATQILPKWKRCIAATDGALGEALGRRFVQENFGAEGKQKTQSLVAEIEAAMKRDLDALPWMDSATRGKALEKLQKIKNKIGYPDVWRNYDSMAIGQVPYATNALAAQAFETKRMLAKIGKPLDRGEWYMTPSMVNAYYDANLNEMAFPAGILQPPFFNRMAADALNYGAIGMVMGHELTHGFDDEGRQFDGDGNLEDWWTESVGKDFERRAQCVVKQFDGYVALADPAGDIHVKGDLTLGENLADLGGLKLAYAAYKDAKKGEGPVRIHGYSEEKTFFLGYAQSWCMAARPQFKALRAKTDPHAPPKWRVNGPVSNMPEFAEAFSCKPGSPMVRKDRCEVW